MRKELQQTEVYLSITEINEIFPGVKNTLPIESNPGIMSGVPVITGTRVPVATLFDYLMKGSTLDEFLDCFPTVRREDVLVILNYSKDEAVAAA